MRFFPRDAFAAKPATAAEGTAAQVQLQQQIQMLPPHWVPPQIHQHYSQANLQLQQQQLWLQVQMLRQYVLAAVPIDEAAMTILPNRVQICGQSWDWQLADCQRWYQGGLNEFGRPIFWPF